ncbi:MAG: hypothetical protein IT165_31420 [Bryobacterales bacterium]|nr:hypothetical protein [Bryobacterales bacterium]
MPQPVYDMALDVSAAIGMDVHYLRRPVKDRQYFTGIEVAITVATGLVGAFAYGVLKGVTESLGKDVGKDLGQRLIELRNGARELDQDRADLLMPALRVIQQELDQVIGGETFTTLPRHLSTSQASQVKNLARAEVEGFLTDAGMPWERAQALAAKLSEQLSRELGLES